MAFKTILALTGVLCVALTAVRAGEMKVFYGHLHNHSSVSDGKGTPAEAYTYARDVAGLDFFALADHAEQISASEWTQTREAARAAHRDGTFTALVGFEWSSSIYGHVTVVNTTGYCTSLQSSTNTFTRLVTWLEQNEGIAFFNHPGRENRLGMEFDNFSTPPTDRFVGMELWNKNDGFARYYYNDGYYKNDGNLGYFDEALTRGWYIGAAGADDNHDATWGTRNQYRFAIWARANTSADIVDALLARRFYATLDKNLVLGFEAAGAPMGSKIGPGNHIVKITAQDGDGEIFTRITLLRNGVVDQTWSLSSADPVVEVTRQMQAGEYWYCIVTQADGNEAISSPIFVRDQATGNHSASIQSRGNLTRTPFLVSGDSRNLPVARLYTLRGARVVAHNRPGGSPVTCLHSGLLIAVP